MRRFLGVLIAVTILLCTFSVWGYRDSVVICHSMELVRGEMLQEQLQDKFPDKNIIVSPMTTGKAAAKIMAEKESTEIDIVVAMEIGYMNKLKEEFADISDISNIPYLDSFTPDKNGNKWITWDMFAGAILVNEDILRKNDLPSPTCYEDLLKPEYQGMIAMPDPKSSGTGYLFYKSWVNSWGEERTIKFVDALHRNLKALTESGSGPIKMLKQGEVAIGLGMIFQAVSEINCGQPLKIIFPETGVPYSLTGAGIIKGKETNADVMEVFDFIANDFIIYDKENYLPDKIYQDQVNRIPNYPQNIPYADMTGIQDDAEKERLLKLWKY